MNVFTFSFFVTIGGSGASAGVVEVRAGKLVREELTVVQDSVMTGGSGVKCSVVFYIFES